MTKKNTRYSKVRKTTTKYYKRWMPYEAAKMTVQQAGIRSRAHYWKWHDDTQPYYIPKFPFRVYTEEWNGWNEFLNNENTFTGWDRANREPWTPYWEAARIVQAHKFKTKREYLDNHDKLEGNIPKAAKEAYGDDWKGWPAFLGVDLISKVEVAQHVVGIVAFCVSSLLPSNVIEVIIAPEGKKQLLDKLGMRDDLSVLRAYVWESDLWPTIGKILTTLASESEPGKYVVPNMHALWYEIDNILLKYNE